MGVTSRMDLISTPAAWRARMADSRPLPGPLTRMSRERRPLSLAVVAQAVAACWAAKGVPLREPLKPRVPALDQVTTLPSRSVMVTWVLLKEAYTWAMPCTTCFFSFFAFFAPTTFVIPGPLNLLRADHGPPRPLAGAGVRVGALAPHGQVAPVAHPPVGADLHEALDVHGDVLAKIALHAPLAVDDLGDAAGLLFGEVLHPHVGVDPGLGQDLVAPAHPDPVDVGEGDLDPLLAREIDACDACHALPLPLFVLLVGADHVDDAPAPHHLALHADLLDRRPYFHRFLTSRPAPHDAAPAHVVGHQLHDHRVPRPQPQQGGVPRHVRDHLPPTLVLQLDPEEGVRELLFDRARHLDHVPGRDLRHAGPPPADPRRGKAPRGSRARTTSPPPTARSWRTGSCPSSPPSSRPAGPRPRRPPR